MLAACLAWQLALWLGATSPPVYAAIVPLVALRDAPFSAFDVSLSRLLGVVTGLAIGMLLLQWLEPTTLALALVLALGLAVSVLLGSDGALNVQVALSALLVFANADPDHYAVGRLWETAVGAGVTLVLAPLLYPSNPVTALEQQLRELEQRLSGVLRTAESSAGQPPDAGLARALDALPDLEARASTLTTDLTAARQSLRLNPLRRRYADGLEALAPPVGLAAQATTQVRLFVEDLDEFAHRPDEHPAWLRSTAPVVAVVEPLATAVEQALERGDASAPLARAQQALRDYMQADPDPLAAVLRRPLHRLMHLVGDLQGRPRACCAGR